MTDDEELDFSSYLVDLDDEEQDIDKYIGPSSFNTAPSSTLTTPNSLIGGSFAASTSYPSSFAAGSGAGSGGTGGVGTTFQPANTHTSSGGASTVKKGELNSNKAWSGALLSQRGFPSVSPSPPESASDSSYKTNSGSISGSGSAPASAAGTGTAPSSIASSSYPSEGGASSWGTQKTLNPQHSLLSATAASGASTSTSNLEGAGAGAVGHSDIGSNLSTPTAEFVPPSSSSTSSSALSASRHHYSSSQSAATSGSLQQLSGKSSTTTHSAKSHNGKSKATSLNSSSSSSNHNHTSSQHPPLDLSFSYDFAHDPSLNTAFSAAQAAHAHGQGALSGTHSAAAAAGPSHTSSTSSASTTTSHHAPPAAAPLSLSEPFNDKSQYSTSLPSSSINGFASRASRGSADRSALANSSSSSSSNNNNNNNTISSIPIPSTSANSSLDLGKPISPSSGPQHVSRGHRSRQASASSGALSSSYSGPSGISAFASGGGSAAGYASSPHWLSMTPTSPSGLPASTGGGGSSGSSGGGGGSATGTSHTSNISGQPHVQFASKPYSRPIAPAPDASGSSGAGHHHHQHQHGGSLPSSSMTGGGAGGSGAGGSSKSGSGGSLSKRPSKRKTISNASSNASASASMHQLQTAGIASLAPLQPQTQGSSSASGSAPSASSSARGGSGQLQQYQLPPNATLLPQASAAATAGVQAQTLAQAQAQAQPLGVSQFGYPVAGSHYRDPMSAVASPISPSLDSFSAFSPNYNLAATPITAASSAATSPSAANSQQYSQYQHAAVISPYIQQQHFQYQQQQQQQQYSQGQASTSASASSKPNSTASTPNDAILSAVTAPSPFDPRNFGSLSFDPLSATDDFAAQQWYGQSAGTPAPSSQAAMEVNRAAALAGIGGKWINWTNSQVEGQDQDANLISTVLHDSPEVANAPTPSAPHASGSGAGPHASGPSKAASPAAMFDPFPHRESSVVTSPSGDIEGLSPEDLAARDPLATHLWRLYAKAKAGLPNGARMENITWRMMSLKLNKQKASAGAGGVGSPPAATQGAQQTSFQPPNTAEVAATSNAVLQEAEEAGRGRRGRSSGPNSASPAADAAEFEEMDWRKHSRSRSRVPQAIAGGMDWRGNSRSRSRAPNMRISMPSGPSGFHLPTYADIVETMASVSRAPQDVATGTSSANATVQPNNLDPQHTFAAPVTLSHISQPGMLSFEQSLKQLVQDRDAQPGDMPAPTGGQASSGGNGPSTAAPYSYVPPAPLPLSPSHWINSPQSVQDGATPAVSAGEVPESSNINIVPGQQTQQSQYEQAVSASSQPQSMPRSGGASIGSDATVDSQKSISASVEAYLSSLEHATSVIDLPPHRHVGSIPGLFNEQELKANQHADYGFIPKLVRKTSFDASYPAQLAHEQQKSKSHKRRQPAQQQEHSGIASPAPQSATPHFSQGNVQNWSDPNNLFLMDNINSYLQGPAQSVPSTPSALSASFTFNFLNQAQPGYSAPFSPYGGDPADLNAQASAQAQVHAQTAAVEAFRRLQNAQALQAANAAAHQQMQHQAQGQTPVYNTPYLDPNYAGSPGTVPPEVFAAAMSAMQYQPAGMHVNPSQVSGLSYSPNAYPGYTDPGTASWPASPQANHPSPVSHYPSPEETAAVAEEGRLQSALSSRASSVSNIPSLLSQSFTADQTPDSPEKSVTKKAHSRHLSAVSTALPESNAEGSGKETVCVNCKTTNTPLWRRDEHGQPLCNACQLFRKLHGSDRPVSLHNSVVKKRNRTRTNKEAPKKSTSRSQRTVASPKPSDEGTAIEAQ